MSTAEGGGNIVTDGLVLYLDAANTKSIVSGSTRWNDLSRSNNNGTLINSPTFNSGNGGSIVFDGINDYVSVNVSSTIPIGSAQRSLSIWFYTNSLTWVPEVNNLFQYGTNVTRQSFGIDFDTYPKMQVWTWLDDLTFDTTYSLLGWKNIMVTYNGSTTLLVYENGVNTQTKTLSGILNTTSTSVYIGSLNPIILSSFYLGNIAQTLIYNRALSSQEVLQNYNATKGRYGL